MKKLQPSRLCSRGAAEEQEEAGCGFSCFAPCSFLWPCSWGSSVLLPALAAYGASPDSRVPLPFYYFHPDFLFPAIIHFYPCFLCLGLSSGRSLCLPVNRVWGFDRPSSGCLRRILGCFQPGGAAGHGVSLCCSRAAAGCCCENPLLIFIRSKQQRNAKVQER